MNEKRDETLSESLLASYATQQFISRYMLGPQGRPALDASQGSPESVEDRYTSNMSTAVPREEHDAKIDAFRQEMRADSAALRGDIERMRADMATMVGGITASVGEVKGSIDGLKSSISTMQWVVGVFMTALGLWLTALQLKQPETQPPAIIINVPPAAPAPAASR